MRPQESEQICGNVVVSYEMYLDEDGTSNHGTNPCEMGLDRYETSSRTEPRGET